MRLADDTQQTPAVPHSRNQRKGLTATGRRPRSKRRRLAGPRCASRSLAACQFLAALELVLLEGRLVRVAVEAVVHPPILRAAVENDQEVLFAGAPGERGEVRVAFSNRDRAELLTCFVLRVLGPREAPVASGIADDAHVYT